MFSILPFCVVILHEPVDSQPNNFFFIILKFIIIVCLYFVPLIAMRYLNLPRRLSPDVIGPTGTPDVAKRSEREDLDSGKALFFF